VFGAPPDEKPSSEQKHYPMDEMKAIEDQGEAPVRRLYEAHQ
jgi:hypothetical protein